MKEEYESLFIQNMSDEINEKYERYVNPADIDVPPGYQIEVFATGLETPISMAFDSEGNMLVGDAGVTSGNGKLLRLNGDRFEVIADGFNPPLTGINYLNGDIYVSHRRTITVIRSDGTKVDILSGLPSNGDHHNNQVVFGPDGKMYFGQGTATNSGVVGLDNSWLKDYPLFVDYPGSDVILNGCNFATQNIFSEAKELTYTSAFSPFGEPNLLPDQHVRGYNKASGSILRANLDGSDLEQVVWGLRNPFRLKFDQYGRLLATNHGADVRGSRPIANCVDEFHIIKPGAWYGWPDYNGGKPVTLPDFAVDGGPQLTLLIANPPSTPPAPFAAFAPHSAIMGFDINYYSEFGPYGDVYIAEYGSEAPETTGGVPLPGVGHRISRIDMNDGHITNFAINKSGVAASESNSGGFDRPIDVLFGPDGAMYILDFAVNMPGEPDEFRPNSGVIWRITKTSDDDCCSTV